MRSVDGDEPALFTRQSEVPGKCGDTASAVAAHAAFTAVGIEVDHFEIIAGLLLQQNESVGADTEAAVAHAFDQAGIGSGDDLLRSLIQHNKVISCSLILPEFHIVRRFGKRFAGSKLLRSVHVKGF